MYFGKHPLPDSHEVKQLCKALLGLLFPVTEQPTSGYSIADKARAAVSTKLLAQLEAVRSYGSFEPSEVCSAFVPQLETIHDMVLKDAEFILEGDPAARHVIEIILSYPGLKALAIYRLAHALYELHVPILPRMMSEWVHSKTGIDIHPGARLACPIYIDHGTGIVIGETAVVGKQVRIYQGVTLGALVVRKGHVGQKRHPTVGDNVVIYANSSILGGQTEIGHDSVIGGNSWLTKSILPYSVVYTKHETVVRDRDDYQQPLDFSI